MNHSDTQQPTPENKELKNIIQLVDNIIDSYIDRSNMSFCDNFNALINALETYESSAREKLEELFEAAFRNKKGWLKSVFIEFKKHLTETK